MPFRNMDPQSSLEPVLTPIRQTVLGTPQSLKPHFNTSLWTLSQRDPTCNDPQEFSLGCLSHLTHIDTEEALEVLSPHPTPCTRPSVANDLCQCANTCSLALRWEKLHAIYNLKQSTRLRLDLKLQPWSQTCVSSGPPKVDSERTIVCKSFTGGSKMKCTGKSGSKKE